MQNYYQFLGLKYGFELDLSELRKAYLKVQLRAHPDRTGELESTAISATANEAFQALQDPLRRAQHMLAIACQKLSVKPKKPARPRLLAVSARLSGAGRQA